MARIRKDVRGQMPLPFGQKKAAKKATLRKGPTLAERKQTKETAFRLAKQAYAIISNAKYKDNKHLAEYKREIGQFIGQCKKNKATFNQAQAKIGMITGLFDSLDVKYKL